ncbi:hypothetical protein FPSE_02753 [Fusarium pseudograminearum CS3096]|uniref:Uncharacterized protein n=1 Tax=Fusarium pseudograminearum (strain CS3096) TaxID=1028729 RepID=K3VQ38_FUSPC|nr:hypothetical protein FPSE_02753 [Fusarium pseudograminearum CS3096]EKJ77109.1 hypothetical protein FPSE_02753 [Fusarium pseudograminearum CS3096]
MASQPDFTTTLICPIGFSSNTQSGVGLCGYIHNMRAVLKRELHETEIYLVLFGSYNYIVLGAN